MVTITIVVPPTTLSQSTSLSKCKFSVILGRVGNPVYFNFRSTFDESTFDEDCVAVEVDVTVVAVSGRRGIRMVVVVSG